ncbi:Hypothetical protein D9617_52g060400 [Elsinoe fawcettii]|nr:Hypothetical protein D9617_52g060400 [Elsinoe fawcettii]
MLEPTPDLMPLYHNRQSHDLSQCSLQLLYARLAWAIFPSLSGYLGKPGVFRRLLVSSKDNRGRVTWKETDEMTSERLRAKVAASRSQSPKKRQRAAEQSQENRGDTMHDARNSSKSADGHSLKRRNVDGTATGMMSENSLPGNLTLPTPPSSASFGSDGHQGSARDVQEYEEDMLFEAELSGLHAEERPPSFYPGHRRIARMKNIWLGRNRPEGYQPPD